MGEQTSLQAQSEHQPHRSSLWCFIFHFILPLAKHLLFGWKSLENNIGCRGRFFPIFYEASNKAELGMVS